MWPARLADSKAFLYLFPEWLLAISLCGLLLVMVVGLSWRFSKAVVVKASLSLAMGTLKIMGFIFFFYLTVAPTVNIAVESHLLVDDVAVLLKGLLV